MTMLVPWPNPSNIDYCVCQGPQEAMGEKTSSLDIAQTLDTIDIELRKLAPLKEHLQKVVKVAVGNSVSKSLQGCRVEVVGSSSWGGDVPQSDLDMVILTPGGRAIGNEAINILKELGHSLEGLSWSLAWGAAASCRCKKDCVPWQSLQLVETAFVPVLRLHCKRGFHCDVCIDQQHSLIHRNSLRRLASARPQALQLVRLVKHCLHRRGLPLAADGGIPSLAWSLIAFSWAFAAPISSSVEELFGSFLKEMQRLSDHALHLGWCAAQDVGNSDIKLDALEWRFRGGSNLVWAEDRMQLLTVDDCHGNACHAPAQRIDLHLTTITPRFVSAALGLLYIVEFRLAWKAFADKKWCELWRTPMHVRPSLNRMKGDGKLHVVLIHGEVYVGKVRSVQFQPGLKRGNGLHHRDQSCDLSLQEVELKKEIHGSFIHAEESKRTPMIWCQPCNWVCALPLGARACLQPEGLLRLAEIFQVVGITRVSHDLCDAVLAWRQSRSQELTPDHIKAEKAITSISNTGSVFIFGVCKDEVPPQVREGLDDIQLCEKAVADKCDLITEFEEDSTRASESDIELREASPSHTESSQISSACAHTVDKLSRSGCDAGDWKPSLRLAPRIVGAEIPVALHAWPGGSGHCRPRYNDTNPWKPSLRHRCATSTS